MVSTRMAAVLVLGAVALVGCKKEEPTVMTPAARRTPAAPVAPAVESPAAGVMDAVGMSEADVQAKLTQVTEYIKDKKFDMADATLKQVEAKKDSLPASLQPKVDSLRKMLDAAKTTSETGITVPSTMPTIPGM